MTFLFVLLIGVIAALLGFFVLIQNPKGGGLASNVGGINNQFMGVKQTTDVLEKGTWLFAAMLGILCLISTVFIPSGKGRDTIKERSNVKPSATAPAARPSMPAGPTVPMPNQ